MAKRRETPKIVCNVIMTEGATERITQAFVDLYYAIKISAGKERK